MKKILSIIFVAMLLAVNITYAAKIKVPKPTNKELKPCFDSKTGICMHCKGTGKVKNKKWSKKRWTEKKYIKCSGCDGKGKKAEEKKVDKPKKYEVEVTCPKCKKKFVYKLRKTTKTKIKRVAIFAKCPHCGKKHLYRMDNPLYTP